VSDPLLEVAALVLRESGVVIRESQLPSLEAAIRRVQPGMTAEQLLTRAGHPGERESLVDRLIDEVTIKETYFLRHREELAAIDWRGLAARAMSAGRTNVRVWSAACASGDEPYSLAILALEAFSPGAAPVDLLATDIAASSIARARAGRYGMRSLRHVEDELRERWFEPQAGGLEIGPAARALVRFARHNLHSDPVPPAGEAQFDLIVCRNVLIYFEPEGVRETITRLRRALVPGGELILGAADRLTGGPDAVSRPAPVEPPARRARPRRSPSARTPRRERRGAPAATPLDAEVEFERGLTAMAEGDATAAVDALRRALYLDPGHAAAAFQLARAHEAGDDPVAARRAYWQALALLDEAGEEVGGVSRRDLQSAARSRLAALGGG
jgi:chemotaxis protein methyltransferase CheR